MNPPETTSTAARERQVLLAVDQLPNAAQRDVLRLRLIGEEGRKLSTQEVARRLRTSADAIRILEADAVRQVRALLGE